jgi:hypothetical protein
MHGTGLVQLPATKPKWANYGRDVDEMLASAYNVDVHVKDW